MPTPESIPARLMTQRLAFFPQERGAPPITITLYGETQAISIEQGDNEIVLSEPEWLALQDCLMSVK